MRARAGFSLIELVVVLVLIGLVSVVAVIAFRSDQSPASDWRHQLTDARRRAMRSGRIVAGYSDSVGTFAAHPGGMIVTDSAPRIRFAVESHAR